MTRRLAALAVLLAGSALAQTGGTNVTIKGALPAGSNAIGGVTESGTWTVQPGNTANTTPWLVTGTGGVFPVTGTFWQATQPVSLAAVPLPSGAATSALQTTLSGQLPAALDGSGFLKTHEQGTASVSAATLPLPAGAATEAGHLATIDTSAARIPAQGQALAAASMPVVLTAAQQTALTPPAAITGFALEAGHVASIDSKAPALGQALAAASVPVVLTAAQQTALTPPAAITGFALEAGHLSSLDTKMPAQGQALAAASLPVVLTAAQQSALTPPAAISGFALEAGHLATIDTSTARIPAQGQALAAASLPVVLTAAQVATLTPLATITSNAGTGTRTVAPVQVASATTTGTCTSVTTTAAILASNSSRHGGILTAIGTNTKRARYAFAATATTSQMPLEAGQSLPLDSSYTGAVSFVSDDGATSITICAVEW